MLVALLVYIWKQDNSSMSDLLSDWSKGFDGYGFDIGTVHEAFGGWSDVYVFTSALLSFVNVDEKLGISYEVKLVRMISFRCINWNADLHCELLAGLSVGETIYSSFKCNWYFKENNTECGSNNLVFLVFTTSPSLNWMEVECKLIALFVVYMLKSTLRGLMVYKDVGMIMDASMD